MDQTGAVYGVWTNLAQNREASRAFVNAAMKLRVS